MELPVDFDNGNDLDVFLDQLPPPVRHKALAAWEKKQYGGATDDDFEEGPSRLPLRHQVVLILGVVGAVVVGLPFIVVGLILCMTIVLYPVGLPIMLFGGVPLGLVLRWWSKKSR